VTSSRSTPVLTLAAEAAPDEATVRAIETSLNNHSASIGLKSDWSPRWIIGRDDAGSVQAGIRLTIAPSPLPSWASMAS